MKFLGTNLTKYIQDLYTEECKTLPKTMKKLLNRDIRDVNGLEDSVLLNASFLPVNLLILWNGSQDSSRLIPETDKLNKKLYRNANDLE